MKDVSNHIEKMVTESKILRDGKPFISEIKMYNNDNKKNKMMKIFWSYIGITLVSSSKRAQISIILGFRTITLVLVNRNQ